MHGVRLNRPTAALESVSAQDRMAEIRAASTARVAGVLAGRSNGYGGVGIPVRGARLQPSGA
jgi:hypothetical protein